MCKPCMSRLDSPERRSVYLTAFNQELLIRVPPNNPPSLARLSSWYIYIQSHDCIQSKQKPPSLLRHHQDHLYTTNNLPISIYPYLSPTSTPVLISNLSPQSSTPHSYPPPNRKNYHQSLNPLVYFMMPERRRSKVLPPLRSCVSERCSWYEMAGWLWVGSYGKR